MKYLCQQLTFSHRATWIQQLLHLTVWFCQQRCSFSRRGLDFEDLPARNIPRTDGSNKLELKSLRHIIKEQWLVHWDWSPKVSVFVVEMRETLYLMQISRPNYSGIVYAKEIHNRNSEEIGGLPCNNQDGLDCYFSVSNSAYPSWHQWKSECKN